MAVRALTAWSHDDWTDTLTATVQEALDREPDSDLRTRLACLLTEQQRQDYHRQGSTA